MHLTRPLVGTDEHDVDGSAKLAVLKGVVEHGNVIAVLHRRCHGASPIGAENHVDVRIELPVHGRFVIAISAHDDGGACTMVDKPPSNPSGNRSFSGTPDRQVA